MKVVGLGGGHGLASTLSAARLYASEIAAIVTVADDGGSSGRLTRELGIPPPGDIRNCLVALSRDERWAEVFQHRYAVGPLTGHTVGNLVIAALAEAAGDFAEGVARAGELLDAVGAVYPATTERVELGARVTGGRVEGQVAVAQTRAPIERVYLRPPDPPGYEGAVAAIGAADQVVLGPGSLYTSLIATLLVPSIRDAVVRTEAQVVFVCNSRMQKGETEGMTASAHLRALIGYLGEGAVDVALFQSPVLGSDGVVVDAETHTLGIAVVEADVARPEGGHHPERLAGVLSRVHE